MENLKLKKGFAFSFLLVVVFVSCKDKTEGLKEVKSKPNVIVLVSDDQGYGDLACHGNPHLKTPNLDKMYNESVRFTDFHTSSICTPTRSQLMTGIDAVRNGAYNYGFGKTNIFESFPDTKGNENEIHLISDFFKANGYKTGHFGKWHLGDFYPYRSMDRGFDETYTFPGASVWQSPNYWNNDCFNDIYYKNGKQEKAKGYSTDVWFSETINFIKKAVNDGEPFFVYLPTSAMHTPQYVPAKYLEPYKHLDPLVAQFYGMIANFDENLGLLDTELEKLAAKENTILVYFSDNGGTCGVKEFNSGMNGKKGSLYDGGHRVPCFVRWPEGIPSPGRDVTDLTVVQDVLPTLIDLCDLEMPWKQKFDGLSVSNLIMQKEQDLSERMSVVQFSTKRNGFNGYSVLWNKWRLIDGDKLYDFSKDLGEKNNVIEEFPEVTKKMQDYYSKWSKSVAPSLRKNSQISIGYPGFEGLDLTSFDWLQIDAEGNPSQQMDIRVGKPMNGSWNVFVEEEGTYELTFRRWPSEIDTEITAGCPPYFSEFSKQIVATKVPLAEEYQNYKSIVPAGGILPAGKALPIANIKLSLGNESQVKQVSVTDKSISFKVEMTPGQIELRGDFLDKKGNIICGAYYVDIKKI